jgi:hypothetical protein
MNLICKPFKEKMGGKMKKLKWERFFKIKDKRRKRK